MENRLALLQYSRIPNRLAGEPFSILFVVGAWSRSRSPVAAGISSTILFQLFRNLIFLRSATVFPQSSKFMIRNVPGAASCSARHGTPSERLVSAFRLHVARHSRRKTVGAK